MLKHSGYFPHIQMLLHFILHFTNWIDGHKVTMTCILYIVLNIWLCIKPQVLGTPLMRILNGLIEYVLFYMLLYLNLENSNIRKLAFRIMHSWTKKVEIWINQTFNGKHTKQHVAFTFWTCHFSITVLWTSCGWQDISLNEACAAKTHLLSLSHQKKDWRGSARQCLFWYDNDNDLKRHMSNVFSILLSVRVNS